MFSDTTATAKHKLTALLFLKANSSIEQTSQVRATYDLKYDTD